MIRLFAFLLLTLQASAELHIRKHETGIDIIENEKLLTCFHFSKVPYFYPILSDSGANLTRHWPIEKGIEGEETDHPHHRSAWLSHGSVDGHDFWAWQGGGKPEIARRDFGEIISGKDFVGFTVILEWVADGEIRLNERRQILIRRVNPKTWTLFTQSVWSAPEDRDVLIGDTKEGTFAVRVGRSLRSKGPMAEGHILDSEGRTDGDCWGKRSRWVAFHGPDENNAPALVAMFDHPKNLRYPCWWHARDYGLLAANPLGIHDFEGRKDKSLGNYLLKRGQPLTFRYLLLIHHGTPSSAHLQRQWEKFSE